MSPVSRALVLRGSKKNRKGKKQRRRKRGWQTIHTYGFRGCNSQQAFILVRGANGGVLERLRSPFHTSFFPVPVDFCSLLRCFVSHLRRLEESSRRTMLMDVLSAKLGEFAAFRNLCPRPTHKHAHTPPPPPFGYITVSTTGAPATRGSLSLKFCPATTL